MADKVGRCVKQLGNWSNGVITKTILLVLFGCAVLSGVGFIAIGSYFSLSAGLAPWAAGLIVGCVLILLSLVGMWITVLYWRNTYQHRISKQPNGGNSEAQSPEAQTMIDTAAHLGEITGASLSRSGVRPTDVVIAALVAGTILGAAPVLRKRQRNRKHYRRRSHREQP